MAKINKSIKRQYKRRRAKNGMRVSNRGIFVIVATIGKKADGKKSKGKRK